MNHKPAHRTSHIAHRTSPPSEVFLLGIGGIGMSALARYFKSLGKSVSGYDLTPSPLTEQLVREGITVFYDDDSTKLPDNIDLAIYTPAVPDDLGLFKTLAQRGVPMKKRAVVLGEIVAPHKTIAIAGTHGKTTTAAILAHIFYQSKFGCTAFVGGIMNNYVSNFFCKNGNTGERTRMTQMTRINTDKEDKKDKEDKEDKKDKEDKEDKIRLNPSNPCHLCSPHIPPFGGAWGGCFILEADEYDRSLLQFKPTVAAINAMDSDHLDIYDTQEALIETYNLFANQIDKNGFLVVKKGLEQHLNVDIEVITVSIEDRQAHYYADNIRIVGGYYHFDLHTPQGTIGDVVFGGGGFVNIGNAVTAAAIALRYGIDTATVTAALQSFTGVQRRFQFRIRHEKMVLIDDYAHHPEEIRMSLRSVRDLYPDKKITAVFQPHLYSRTRDFADGFAETLAMADELLLLDIYPARELPIEGVSSEMILSKMTKKNGKLVNKQNLINEILNIEPQVVVMLGAGDIDRLVAPVEEALRAMI